MNIFFKILLTALSSASLLSMTKAIIEKDSLTSCHALVKVEQKILKGLFIVSEQRKSLIELLFRPTIFDALDCFKTACQIFKQFDNPTELQAFQILSELTKQFPLASILHIASGSRNRHILHYCIKEKQNLLNAPDCYGRTPLHWAILAEDLDAIRTLINSGAQIEAKDKDGLTPLHLSVRFGICNVAKLLIEMDAQIETQDNDKRTPLHTAIYYAKRKIDFYDLEFERKVHRDIIKVLIEKKAHIDAQDTSGETPLHYAAKTNTLDLIELLVNEKAQLETKDNDGRTPLHLATVSGKPKAVQRLIDHKAQIETTDKHGRTPLHIAAGFRKYKVAKILIENKAHIESVDNNGKTPLDLALENGDPIADLLKNALPNAQDSEDKRSPNNQKDT